MDLKLDERKAAGNKRYLGQKKSLIDFASNDFLGLSTKIRPSMDFDCGSTGSRLLTGNSSLCESLEKWIADFHDADAGLIFNCGYMANLGLLSALLQPCDLVLFDSEIHASTRDGIRLCRSKGFHFKHNDLDSLEQRLRNRTSTHQSCYVCVESIYSCDGSYAPLVEMADLCEKHGAHLIVDEAHATGVCGHLGKGRLHILECQARVFARVHTFSKAVGVHGAIVLGSTKLKEYLINFSRPFIYTTALPPLVLEAIKIAYAYMVEAEQERQKIDQLIQNFRKWIKSDDWPFYNSHTHIQALKVMDNAHALSLSAFLQSKGFDVRALTHPTVSKGGERLRFCLHAFNSIQEIETLFVTLKEAFSAEKP